jgi:hypothetical protein
VKKNLLLLVFTVFLISVTGFAAQPVIKVGHHIGFDRIVFNSREKIPFSIERFPSYAVIRFDKTIDIDVEKLYKTLAPSLRRISVEMEKNQTIMTISAYPSERLLKSNHVKGAFYFDLYWPKPESSCETKKEPTAAFSFKNLDTGKHLSNLPTNQMKDTNPSSEEKANIKEQAEQAEKTNVDVAFVQNEPEAEYTFIETQTPDGVPYTILRFLKSNNFYAFFYKDGYYWVVFPASKQRKIPAYFNTNGAIQEIIQLPHKEAFIVRLTINPSYDFVEVMPDGDIYFAKEAFFVPKVKSSSVVLLSSEKGVEVQMPTAEQTFPVRFYDPVVGNEIIALASSKNCMKEKYSYAFMENLFSARGIVFISKTEYLEAVPSENGFLFIP